MSPGQKRRSVGAPGRSLASRTAILLESIQEQNKATIEAVFASEQKLNRKMDELHRGLTLRIEALEAAVRQNSADIKQNSEDIRRNTEELRQHSEEIRKMQETLQRKLDRDELKALENRVTALEKRVGI
jgi:chromosome segregation ATPase